MPLRSNTRFLEATTVMSGAEDWKDIKDFGEKKLDWLRQYRAFNHGIPAAFTVYIDSKKMTEVQSCIIDQRNVSDLKMYPLLFQMHFLSYQDAVHWLFD